MVYKFLSNIVCSIRNMFDNETSKRLKKLQQESFTPVKREDLILQDGQKMTLTFTSSNMDEVEGLVDWLERLKKVNKPIPFKNAGFDLRIKNVYVKINQRYGYVTNDNSSENIDVVLEGELVL